MRFTADNSDLKQKFNENKQSIKSFEDEIKKTNTEMAKLKLSDIKAKLSLDTADYKAKHAEIRKQMLELQAQKINLQIDTAEAKEKMSGFQQFTQSLLGKITFGNLLATGITAGLDTIKQGFQALTNTMMDSLKVSSEYEVSLRALDSVSKSFGQSQSKANDYARQLASDGLINVSNASQTLKNLLSTGFNIEQAFDIAKNMKDIGAFNNVVGDLGLAMETSARGFRINSIELIDNIGLTERLSSIMKHNNVDISAGIDLTNNAAQRQAIYNAILAEGAKNSGAAAEYAKLYGGALDKTKQSIKDFQAELGNMLKGPAGEFLKIFSSGVNSITVILKTVNEPGQIEAGKKKGGEDAIQAYNKQLDNLNLKLAEAQKNLSHFQELEKKIGDRDKTGDWRQTLEFYKTTVIDLEKQITDTEAALTRLNKASTAKQVTKGEQAKTEQTAMDDKAYKDFIASITAGLKQIDKIGQDTGQTFEDIGKYKLIFITDKMKDFVKSGQDGTKQYAYLQNVFADLKSNIEGIKPEITVSVNLDEESRKNFEKQFGDVIKLKEKINKIQTEWELKPKIFGTETFKNDMLKVVDEQIKAVMDAMATVDVSTKEGMTQLESMKQLLDSLQSKKIKIDVEAVYSETGENTSGYDPSRYYGKTTGSTTMEGVKTYKETKKQADEDFTKSQEAFYKNLEAIQNSVEAFNQYVNDSKNGIASGLSEIGNTLNNDFINTLADVVKNIINLQESLADMKTAKALGGAAGAVGAVAAGVNIAAAVVGVGAAIVGMFTGAGKQQESAAEKMASAVEEFKKSIQGMTVKEISTQGQSLSKQLELKNKELSDLNKIHSDFISSTSRGKYTEATGLYFQIEKKLGKTTQEIATLQAELAIIKPTIIEALNITWQDLASGVRSAFDASNLTEFYSQFKESLQKNIKDALVSAFLQSEVMKGMFTRLSDSIYEGLANVGFDASQLTSEQMDAWNSQITALSKEGKAFYEILVKLGLAGQNASDALNSTASVINSIPGGFKVAAYRFKAVATSVTSKTSTGERIYEPGNQPFVGGTVSGPTYNINTVSIPIQSTMNSAEVKSAVVTALDSIQSSRVG